MSSLLDFLRSQRTDFRSARLHSLYSDFRSQRTTNPDGFAANVAAWETGLAAAAEAGVLPEGTLTLQYGPQLDSQLQTREYGIPQALETVLEEAVTKHHFIPLSQFLSSPKSIYDKSWDLNLSTAPQRLTSWALKQAGLISKYQKDISNRYVIVGNAERAGAAVANVLLAKSRRVDRLLPLAEFRREAAAVLKLESLSDSDLEILLAFLHRDKNVIVYNDKAVKVKSGAENTAVLNPEDVHICSLKSLISDINVQILSISERIDQQHAKAKDAVVRKNKVSALAALRSKRLQEDLLAKRSETLAQLENVFAKIEEASDQVEVVKAMEGSTAVLRSLTKEIGGIERVEDVLDNLHEEMAKANEVGDLIGQQGTLASGIDETAVDDELEQMEAAARADEQRAEAEETQKRLEALHVGQAPLADHLTEHPDGARQDKPVAAE